MNQLITHSNTPSFFTGLYGSLKTYLSKSTGENDMQSRYDKIAAEFYALYTAPDQSTLLSISDPEGNITYVNGNFCRMSQYSFSELIGRPQCFVLHSDTLAGVFTEMHRTITSGEIWEGELKSTDKNGDTHWVSAVTSPIFDESGKPARYISIWKKLVC
ncbi:MAG TPA: PAS domain-containing protein [Bacteroidia bacterium]|nr:PAS domain-containing protein [Bacteroidia bacterium]